MKKDFTQKGTSCGISHNFDIKPSIMRRLITLVSIIPSLLMAQDDQRKITFPDVDGYQTLVCDLHQHTVFSDGSVWPDIRVREAIFDGVDVISLTEHIEYQPHKDDIPHPDRNRSFEIAREYAKNSDLIVLHGAEITRSLPPGHSNAIFIQDANKLILDDPLEVFREADRQGAFIFWNHPNWTGQKKNGVAELSDLHRQLISENLLHGIEVVNETTYSDEAMNIALQNDLTVMGTSDIHGLIDWLFDIPGGGHRPVTLVFSKERSEAGIKEGLQSGRTVAWHKNLLIGKAENLKLLTDASLQISEARYRERTEVLRIVFNNLSDARYILKNTSEYTFHENGDLIEIMPNGETSIQVKTGEVLQRITLTFEVLNALSSPGQHPEIEFKIEL